MLKRDCFRTAPVLFPVLLAKFTCAVMQLWWNYDGTVAAAASCEAELTQLSSQSAPTEASLAMLHLFSPKLHTVEQGVDVNLWNSWDDLVKILYNSWMKVQPVFCTEIDRRRRQPPWGHRQPWSGRSVSSCVPRSRCLVQTENEKFASNNLEQLGTTMYKLCICLIQLVTWWLFYTFLCLLFFVTGRGDSRRLMSDAVRPNLLRWRSWLRSPKMLSKNIYIFYI